MTSGDHRSRHRPQPLRHQGRVHGATIAELAAQGIDAEVPTSPDGSDDFLTSWIVDPDGNRIELVQWPPGHPDGITTADTEG